MPWHKPTLAPSHLPVPTCATPRWCHTLDPRRESRTPPALEIALTARLAGVFDPDARAHGAPAAGIASLFRILGEHKTEAACALLNVVQHELRPYGLEGASLFVATVPLAERIVEALSLEPEQAAACILEARLLSSTKRLDSLTASSGHERAGAGSSTPPRNTPQLPVIWILTYQTYFLPNLLLTKLTSYQNLLLTKLTIQITFLSLENRPQ